MQNPPGKFISEIQLPRRVYLTIAVLLGLALLLFFAWNLAGLMTLLFSGILIAIPFRAASDFLVKKLRLPSALALTLVIVLLIALAIGGVWLLAEPVGEQFQLLAEVLPKSIILLRNYLDEFEWGQDLLNQLLRWEDVISNRFMLIDRAMLVFSNTMGAFLSLLIVVLLSVYFAADPQIYLNGLIRLVPIPMRGRARQVFDAVHSTLKWWLFGRVLSMTSVGIMVTVALLIMQVPLAFALGIMAALFDFIPNVGPFLGTIPAVLIGFAKSPSTALTVLIVYFVIQQIESYLITPIIQQQTVDLPPALTISAQIMMTLLLGPVGLFIASPLVAVVIVLVRMLYVEDLLGDVSAEGQPAIPPEPESETPA